MVLLQSEQLVRADNIQMVHVPLHIPMFDYGAMVNLRELGTLHFFDTVYVYIYTYIVDRYVNDPIINDDTLR